MHLRSQIRDFVVALLGGLPTTGARVYASRVHRAPNHELPCLLVYTLSETSQPNSICDGEVYLSRSLDLAIEALAQGDDVDDTLDTIAAEVEARIGGDITFGALVREAYLTESRISLSGEAEKRTGALRLSFRVNYATRMRAPEIAA